MTAARDRYFSRATASASCPCSIPCRAATSTSRPRSRRCSPAEKSTPGWTPPAWTRSSPSGPRGRRAVERIAGRDIARVFPDVIRHAETPLLRTAPAPLYLLSRLTRGNGIKVVLTGEGADEVFLGYDLFKDTAVRLFCLRHPESAWRGRLFDRVYPHLMPPGGKGEFWRDYFLSAGAPDDPLFSHLPRFRLAARIKEFYAADF